MYNRVNFFTFLLLKECRAPENLENGDFDLLPQKRSGFYLSEDMFKYVCENDYKFHTGNSKDYIYKCQDNKKWNNTDIPICVTSKSVII